MDHSCERLACLKDRDPAGSTGPLFLWFKFFYRRSTQGSRHGGRGRPVWLDLAPAELPERVRAGGQRRAGAIVRVCYRFASPHLEMTMLTRRMITLLLAGASIAFGAPAMGQGKVVVYTSNDSNLNRFIFEEFKKETGIVVEQVEAGSGVILRRMASERERPL